jgi:NAD(P)-dependent dehydrogenase (short-subunit alcohol dehydrogenase family)
MAVAEVTAPTAVVAGGAGSIGRVLCRGLADHGFRVVILDAAAGADEVGRDVGAEARRCDLTDHAAIRDSVGVFATQGSEFVTGQSLIVDGGQLFG